MSKLPAMQFYPADWRKDPGIQICSFKTRGIWFEMLCVMFECTPRGYFTVNGRDFTHEEASRILGCSAEEYKESLEELERNQVLSRDCHGLIFNRRMVKDQKVRDEWAKRQRAHRGNVTQVSPKSHTLSSSSSSSSKSKPLSGTPDIPYQEIIEYLNSKTNQNYRSTSKDTQEHIAARWKDGATLADFKRAIDNMTAKWLYDPKMAQYLRPATLFAKGKFDGYVNQVVTRQDRERGFL